MNRYLATCCRTIVVWIVVVATTDDARADAIVVTRAMRASTIAETFIEDGQILVEIEVGMADLAAFANILPDEAYKRVTGVPRPLDERIRTCLESDWVVAGNSQPLDGHLVRVVPGKRIVRDDVTGEALADQPADAELVIRLALRYEFDERPQSLTIRPPMTDNKVAANIGFVCYHDGLPINDFRYMPGEVTLDLDWDDPWFSKFRNPNLRRQFDAPLSAYLYIEPYEIRKEIIIRPKDLEAWLELGLQDDGVIRVEQQDKLKQRVTDFLSERNPVTINGQPAQGRLDRIHFIHRTLRSTGIIEPAVDLDATSATLGVIFVYPNASLPEQVSMRWELFTPKVRSIPAVASDEAGGLPSKVTPDAPLLEWKNYLINPTSPQMLAVAHPLSRPQFAVPIVSVLGGCIAAGCLVVLVKQRASGKHFSRPVLAVAVATLAVGVVSFPVARVTIHGPFDRLLGLSEEAGRQILSCLLYNVYRSFDHHDERLVYDRLAQSISGDLLSDVYLETRKSMEVKNQGGLRISVKEVSVTELDSVDGNVAEPTFQCRWRVSGWIGHWGHIHRRENEHAALITIAARNGRWKITSMEMLDERSIDTARTPSDRQGVGA